MPRIISPHGVPILNFNCEDVENIITEKIESLLIDFNEKNPANKILPLLRLKIEVSDLGMLKTTHILSKFSSRYIQNLK